MEKNETKLFPVWKELVKQALDWEYEKTHTHQQVADILGIEPQTERYYANVKAARDALIGCGLLLATSTGNGYYVTEPDRHAEEAHKDMEKSRKFLSRNLIKLQMARIDEMSIDARSRHDLITVKTRGLCDMFEPVYMETTTIITKKLFQPKEQKPQIEEKP